MRLALLILVTILLSLTASWLLWREKLTPTSLTPQPSPVPTHLQRQFGWRATGGLADAMEQRLPADFSCEGGFGPTVQRMRDATGAKIWVSWRNIEHAARLMRETPVPASLAGMKLRDAVPAMLASLHGRAPLTAIADSDGVLEIELTEMVIEETTRGIYDVTDLMPNKFVPPVASIDPAANAFIADIEKHVPTKRNDPLYLRTPRMLFVKGKLHLYDTPFAQYDVVQYLNRKRERRAQWEFAKPAVALTGGCVAFVLLVHGALRLRALRRAVRLGLCRRCGYDLRASTDRCPECGAEMARKRSVAA
jgi:hypothetical protein